MSVWFAIPSAREEAQARLDKWRERGYLVAVWRDHPTDVTAEMVLRGQYPGYYRSINALTVEILARDPAARWIVTGGDDTDPDPKRSPAQIADECAHHFGGTFGVMQPIGDRWGEEHFRNLPYAERVAGSPWMGREWCERAYGGRGPMPSDYTHYYGDEELQLVAQRLGVFWQRMDVCHYHDHYMRGAGVVPSFHRNATKLFAADGQIFKQRKALGFPGSQLK